MGYYIQYNGQVIGPMSKEQIVAYGANCNTPVSDNGCDWKPLYNYPELMEVLSRKRNTEDDSRKLVCGILSILIGGLGLQYFLIGKTTAGIINIALTLVTCGMWHIVNLIQGIMILSMSDEEYNRKFVDSTATFPIF